jgi:RsiW-degrading membrane proteinase PrsW (M82 family)
MLGIQYAAYVLCVVLAVLLVYHYDLYDREPWYLLLSAVIVGAAVMRLLGRLEDRAIAALAGAAPSVQTPALVAASFEEAVRLLIVVLLAALLPKIFNDRWTA